MPELKIENEELLEEEKPVSKKNSLQDQIFILIKRVNKLLIALIIESLVLAGLIAWISFIFYAMWNHLNLP